MPMAPVGPPTIGVGRGRGVSDDGRATRARGDLRVDTGGQRRPGADTDRSSGATSRTAARVPAAAALGDRGRAGADRASGSAEPRRRRRCIASRDIGGEGGARVAVGGVGTRPTAVPASVSDHRLYRSASCSSSSGVMSTARALDPSDGPTTPRRSSRSISRPALEKPTRSLRCNIDVDPS